MSQTLEINKKVSTDEILEKEHTEITVSSDSVGVNQILNYTIEELDEVVKECKESKFRAKQLFEWFHKKRVCNYDEMLNLPIKFRENLKNKYPIEPIVMLEKYTSNIDGTIKYLFELNDSHIIESVLMRYKHGNSVCISSQVGCRMGCTFCASTVEGRVRNLMASEMLAQVYAIGEDTGERITNIVVMGSGEPLEELSTTLRFIELINHEAGQNIGQRHITISTCGLVPEIKLLADKKLQINLAISLHAATDDKRKAIMPITRKYGIEELLNACRYFTDMTGRRITFEYALISEENDFADDAKRLGELLKGMLCHVNLIPVNKIEERKYTSSPEKRIDKFKIILEGYGVTTTLRRTLGADIEAACGQLRRRYLKKRGE